VDELFVVEKDLPDTRFTEVGFAFIVIVETMLLSGSVQCSVFRLLSPPSV
jgi:hypothetical protein